MHSLSLEEAKALPVGQMKDWAYNALDCTGTREVLDVLKPHLIPATAKTYGFERALQGPAMSMMLRGVRIDRLKRDQMITELKRELVKDEKGIAGIEAITDIWDGKELETGFCPSNFGKRDKWPKGEPDETRHCALCGAKRQKVKPFEPNSSAQAHHLFYDLFQIEPMTNKTGEVSTDDDVLNRVGKKYPHLKPITTAILAIRDKRK